MSIVYEIVNEMTVQQLHGAIYSPVQATGVGLWWSSRVTLLLQPENKETLQQSQMFS